MIIIIVMIIKKIIGGKDAMLLSFKLTFFNFNSIFLEMDFADSIDFKRRRSVIFFILKALENVKIITNF